MITTLILIFDEDQPHSDKAKALNQFSKAIAYDEVVNECKEHWEIYANIWANLFPVCKCHIISYTFSCKIKFAIIRNHTQE